MNQAVRIDTKLRWANGLAQLADCLTKPNQRKVFLKFLANGKRWSVVHDEKFIAGRKSRKRELEQATRGMQEFFVGTTKEMARRNQWPWEETNESRSIWDVSLEDPFNLAIPGHT